MLLPISAAIAQTEMNHQHGAGFPEPDWVVIAPEGLEEPARMPATGKAEALEALGAGWKAYHAGELEVAGRWFHAARLLDPDCLMAPWSEAWLALEVDPGKAREWSGDVWARATAAGDYQEWEYRWMEALEMAVRQETLQDRDAALLAAFSREHRERSGPGGHAALLYVDCHLRMLPGAGLPVLRTVLEDPMVRDAGLPVETYRVRAGGVAPPRLSADSAPVVLDSEVRRLTGQGRLKEANELQGKLLARRVGEAAHWRRAADGDPLLADTVAQWMGLAAMEGGLEAMERNWEAMTTVPRRPRLGREGDEFAADRLEGPANLEDEWGSARFREALWLGDTAGLRELLVEKTVLRDRMRRRFWQVLTDLLEGKVESLGEWREELAEKERSRMWAGMISKSERDAVATLQAVAEAQEGGLPIDRREWFEIEPWHLGAVLARAGHHRQAERLASWWKTAVDHPADRERLARLEAFLRITEHERGVDLEDRWQAWIARKRDGKPEEAWRLAWPMQEAPNWKALESNLEEVTAADYAGRPYLAIFYLGSGCVHCIEQLQDLTPVAPAFEEAGIALLAFTTQDPEYLPQTEEKVREVEDQFPFRVLSDREGAAFRAFGAYDEARDEELHGLFLVDGEGRIQWWEVGRHPFDEVKFLPAEFQRLLHQNTEKVVRRLEGR